MPGDTRQSCFSITVGVWGQASCLTYPPPSSTHRQFTGEILFLFFLQYTAACCYGPDGRGVGQVSLPRLQLLKQRFDTTLARCPEKKQNPLPPVNWWWVEEGGGYVRHEAWPHTPTVTHQGSAIFTRAAASSPRPLVRRRQYLPRRGATGGIRTHDLNRLAALLYQLSYGWRALTQLLACNRHALKKRCTVYCCGTSLAPE